MILALLAHRRCLCAEQEFDGRWVVEPGGSGGAPVTTLRYEISLVPKLSIPSAALVHVIRSGLPANMQAVAQRAEEVRALGPACRTGACPRRFQFRFGWLHPSHLP